MDDQNGFAAFMEAQQGAVVEKLKRGQRVTGPVSHISADTVFVTIGTRADGRVPRSELLGPDGQLTVELGQELTATVLEPDALEGPRLAVAMGGEQGLDEESLQLALESGTPLVGRFTRAVKGGLEVDLNGTRGFCPASQLDLHYVSDLTSFEGQPCTVAVLELRERGRSVLVSRRSVLEQAQRENAQAALERLTVGATVQGVVTALKPFGAFVDLGGVSGLLHVSEMGGTRGTAPADLMSVGEEVAVRVTEISPTDEGPRIRLALDRQGEDTAPAPTRKDQVLEATVVKLLAHGVLVRTAQGEGFIPKRELALPPGADHRRALSVEQTLEVAVLDGTPGNLRFSVARVQDVQAAQDFQAYRAQLANEHEAEEEQGASSSLAAQLGKLKLGPLPQQTKKPVEKPGSPAKSSPKATTQPTAVQGSARAGAATRAPAHPNAKQSAAAPAKATSTTPNTSGPSSQQQPNGEPPSDDTPAGPARKRRIVRSR